MRRPDRSDGWPRAESMGEVMDRRDLRSRTVVVPE